MRSILAAAIALAYASVAHGQSFTRLVSFGDSLSDVGNTSSLTFGISPGSHYYNGRYSNGPLWVDHLSADLQLGASIASRSSGNNFATGGSQSGTGHVSPVFFVNLPNAITQVNSFLSTRTPGADDLVTLWTGGNDFLDGQTDPAIPANNVQSIVTQLSNAGIRNIAVANLPPLGETPRYRSTANRATMNTRTQQFNTLLATGLNTLGSSVAAHVYQVDVANFFSAVLANPGAYNIANTTGRALGTDNVVVSDPDRYLFWDDVHPTRYAHSLLGELAFDVVTERRAIGTNSAWNLATSWHAQRVPDELSNVVIADSSVTLGATTTVRELRLKSTGRLSLDLSASGARLQITDAATLNGTIGIGFAADAVWQPGDILPAITFASAIGSPTLVNETGYLGLRLDPVLTSTSLAVAFSATPGDANLDSLVNFDDLLILAQHYGNAADQTWLTGDFNRDAAVGFDDLLALAQHYQSAATFESDWNLARSMVPEPASAILLLLGATHFGHRRRRV